MKYLRAEASREIAVPAATLWATIEQTTGMENWYPDLIISSKIAKTDGEITRICIMKNGATLEERILVKDNITRTFVYAVDVHPLPAKNVIGTIRIDDLGDGCRVNWDAQFSAEDSAAEETLAMVNGMYSAGLDSLATFHNV